MFIIQYLNANTGKWQQFRDYEFEGSKEAGAYAWTLTADRLCKFRIATDKGVAVREVA